jgi:hypothetical protein
MSGSAERLSKARTARSGVSELPRDRSSGKSWGVDDDLANAHTLLGIVERVIPEPPHWCAYLPLRRQQLGDGRRHQNLAPVSERQQPGAPVERRAEIIAVTPLGGPNMDRRAHL